MNWMPQFDHLEALKEMFQDRYLLINIWIFICICVSVWIYLLIHALPLSIINTHDDTRSTAGNTLDDSTPTIRVLDPNHIAILIETYLMMKSDP